MKTCKRGHSLVGSNRYVIPSTGKLRCRVCRLARDRKVRKPGNPYLGRYAVQRTL